MKNTNLILSFSLLLSILLSFPANSSPKKSESESQKSYSVEQSAFIEQPQFACSPHPTCVGEIQQATPILLNSLFFTSEPKTETTSKE